MRRWAFVVAVFGMFVLVMFLGFFGKEVESLEGLEVNQKVYLEGEVVEERFLFGNSRLLVLDNGIELVCECSGSFKGRDVEVVGVVSEFEGNKQVEVLEIVG